VNPSLRGSVSRLGLALLTGALIAGLALYAEPASGATRMVPESHATIQAAIDASATGDTVLIGPGTYRGVGNRDIELRGRNLVVKSRNGPEQTIIDCENAGRGFYLHGYETRAARIEGITVQNGYARYGSPGSPSGGGILCSASSPAIVNCRISGCSSFRGGGMSLATFHGVVDGCTISGNQADEMGGGVAVGWAAFQEAEIKNCVVTGNRADTGGGISFGESGINGLTGCTVSANSSERDGGGIFTGFPIVLDRCIVWGNCSDTGADQIRCGNADIRCSDVDRAGVVTTGTVVYDGDCVNTDPMFCDPYGCGMHTQGDWSLDAASPCLASHSPCGELIGALGLGCGAPTGACCLADGSCLVLTAAQCADQHGTYMGDDTPCDSSTCQPTSVQATTWGQIKASYR
jgi:hypothetical protein